MENSIDQSLCEAVGEFILRRLNESGVDEPEALKDARAALTAAYETLTHAAPNHRTLLHECENAYGLVDGETMHLYYRRGLLDGLAIIRCCTGEDSHDR